MGLLCGSFVLLVVVIAFVNIWILVGYCCLWVVGCCGLLVVWLCSVLVDLLIVAGLGLCAGLVCVDLLVSILVLWL